MFRDFVSKELFSATCEVFRDTESCHNLFSSAQETKLFTIRRVFGKTELKTRIN